MTSMRGRGRGARGSPVGGDSIRRGAWRGGPPGSAGYASSRNANSNAANSNKLDDKVAKAVLPDKPRGFQTDADISASSRTAERELKPWSADESPPPPGPNGASAGSAQAVRDALTFGMGASSVPWDQFETNTRLFGAKTDYHEELYTTKLDRSGVDYKKRERNADRLAAEIMSKTSSNPHIAEERGQATPGEPKDEEEKYSGVVRGQGAYVPPGARKAAVSGPGSRKDTPKESPKLPSKVIPKEPPSTKEAASKETPAVATSKTNGNTVEPAAAPNTVASIPTPPVLVASASSSPSPAPPALISRHSNDAVAMDPAIASLGPTPATATSMARSTSSVPPQQHTNGADREHASATTPVSKAPIGAVLDQARQFVESERERATARKQSMVKNERAHVLADLKSWQAKFKVPLPIPKDILPILSKNETKQKEIEAKADKSLHEAQERKKIAAVIKSPAAVPSATLSPEGNKAPGIKKIPMKIPEIPPFRKKMPPAVPVPETAAQNIAIVTSPTPSNASVHSGTAQAKLNPNASTFVFKPTAAAFQPASSVTSPASTSAKLPTVSGPSVPSSSPSTTATPAAGSSSVPKNPFYRDGPPKRIAVDPRSDFSPFKHGQVPPASTIPLQWPYTGRRSSVAFGNVPMHPTATMQPVSFEGEDPSSPHQGPPPMLQTVPPNLVPFYRYQPGMPPVQGGMMGPMFSPAPGFMPPQMGSPHLGQPPHQGPNMPMYFAANGMPPNAHFGVPPQMMHFHPNGPGRPGPGGPMFYPQQMGGHQAPPMQPQMSFQGQPTPPQPHFQQALPPQGGPPGPPASYEASPGQ